VPADLEQPSGLVDGAGGLTNAYRVPELRKTVLCQFWAASTAGTCRRGQQSQETTKTVLRPITCRFLVCVCQCVCVCVCVDAGVDAGVGVGVGVCVIKRFCNNDNNYTNNNNNINNDHN
jgi:hypothetical protein